MASFREQLNDLRRRIPGNSKAGLKKDADETEVAPPATADGEANSEAETVVLAAPEAPSPEEIGKKVTKDPKKQTDARRLVAIGALGVALAALLLVGPFSGGDDDFVPAPPSAETASTGSDPDAEKPSDPAEKASKGFNDPSRTNDKASKNASSGQPAAAPGKSDPAPEQPAETKPAAKPAKDPSSPASSGKQGDSGGSASATPDSNDPPSIDDYLDCVAKANSNKAAKACSN